MWIVASLINNWSYAKTAVIKSIVKARTAPPRVPITKTPADYGMSFEALDIMSSDGIRLSAWEIPCKDSDKLVIVNHPLMCNRYGTTKGLDGVNVEFLPMVKALHEAGYSVITYDQRGQGESDGGLGELKKGEKECPVGVGATEWQDMVGVLKFVAAHDTYAKCSVGLVTLCMGSNATLKAWTLEPKVFEAVNIKAFVGIQPVISNKMVSRMTKVKLGVDISEEVAAAMKEEFDLVGVDAKEYVGAVTVPAMFAQVKADVYTSDENGSDTQEIFDACKSSKKELIWVGPGSDNEFGTGKRFDMYNYFSEKPQQLIEFLNESF